MSSSPSTSYDITVIGAGFAGSITALCLHQKGFDVCLIEKERHPRFAIGESSTPIADMVLRSLAQKYDLPWLIKFSRYSSWQTHHPEIPCGLKRGFSYYKHQLNKPFSTSAGHSHELLVAASVNNSQSDTNWFRADFDAFLINKVQEYSIPYFDETEITSVRKTKNWNISALQDEKLLQIECDFLVDATGNSKLAEQFLDVKSTSQNFKTTSRAIFSHFEHVQPWREHLEKNGISDHDYPYHPDYSALHHLLQNGWLWMLRFNTGVVSAGLALDLNANKKSSSTSPESEWQQKLQKYPSLSSIFNRATRADEPGNIIRTGRLQRRSSHAVGEGWAALPSTAAFVDPLHSTGIAHTLSGVERLLNILERGREDTIPITDALRSYERALFDEVEMIDMMVSGCYKSLNHFELFTAYTMLYFIAAIHDEQQRLQGLMPTHFLSADNAQIKNIIRTSYMEICKLTRPSFSPSKSEIQRYKNRIRKRIAPFNIAGLMNPAAQNMYHHTAAKIR